MLSDREVLHLRANEEGVPFGAEIIPYEPDPDSAGGGIGFQKTGVPFFIWIN